MKLKIYKSLWGMEHLPLEEQFEKVAAAGYAGIESGLPQLIQEPLFRKLLEEYNLEFSAMAYTGGDHIESLRRQVERAAGFAPTLINAHSAKDDMPYERQLEYFQSAAEIEAEFGVTLAHETHRGRALFTPWTTERLLLDMPDLKLTADFSHWCCVCESLLPDQTERLKLAASRSVHVHARVGHPEGPQVNHPAAAEHADALAAHTDWWRDIARARRDAGAKSLTFVPEFGPPSYLQTLPFTNRPVADLWEVCLWMKEYLERNWDDWLA